MHVADMQMRTDDVGLSMNIQAYSATAALLLLLLPAAYNSLTSRYVVLQVTLPYLLLLLQQLVSAYTHTHTPLPGTREILVK